MCAASGPSSTAWACSPASATPLPWTLSALAWALPQVKGLSELQLPESRCDAHAPWCGHHLQFGALPEYKQTLMCTSQPCSCLGLMSVAVYVYQLHMQALPEICCPVDCKAGGIQYSSRLKHKLVK